MRSLISWQGLEQSSNSQKGGKSYEASILIPLIPVHYWYVEAFAGSIVLLLNKPISQREFANDKFSCLVNFWKCIQTSRLARRLMRLCENTLDSRFMYQAYMRQKPEELSIVDRAYRFMYLVTFGFNSYMDTYYTPISHRIKKIKDHMNLFRNNGRRMFEVHNRIKNVMFTDYDFRDCLKKIKPHKDKFILLDPPYLKTHQYNRGYGQDLNFPENYYEDMRDLLLKQHKGGTKWMITCNEINPYFDEMPDITLDYISRRACINKNEERKEVRTKVVMNYSVKDGDVESCLSMYDKPHGEVGLI